MHHLLSQVALVDQIPADALARLAARGRPRTYASGQRLSGTGEIADAVYLILKGRVQVAGSHRELTTPVPLGELGPGSVVSPDGWLGATSRSLTVTAIEVTEALELSGIELLGQMSDSRI